MKLRHLLMSVQGVMLCLALAEPAMAGGFLGGLLGIQDSSPHTKPYAVLDENFYPASVVWSPDGKYLLVGHYDKSGTLDIIDMRTFKVIESLGANGFVASLAVDPSRSRFVVTLDHRLMIWDFVDKP